MTNTIYRKLSLNTVVKVRLNGRGISLLQAQHEFYRGFVTKSEDYEKYGDFIIPSVDENGYTEIKLWELMKVFGEYCFYEGTQEDERYLPFEPEILINNECLKLVDTNIKILKK